MANSAGADGQAPSGGATVDSAKHTAAVPVAATQSAVIGSPAAVRGAVQKTFVAAKVLCGFTDEAHRTQLTGEYLADQGAQIQQQQLDAATAARAFVATLQPF